MDQRELRRLARVGAQARLAELDRERAALLRVFPDLRASARNRANPGAGARPARRRRVMSPAERKAVSLRMKRYWAARRKQQ